jgi:hypothetical protein
MVLALKKPELFYTHRSRFRFLFALNWLLCGFDVRFQLDHDAAILAFGARGGMSCVHSFHLFESAGFSPLRQDYRFCHN